MNHTQENTSKTKILICGATGFIGRNLTEHFAKNEKMQVYAVYNKRPSFTCKNVTWIQADLTKKEVVDEVIDEVVKDIGIVIQAAATTSGSKDIVTKPYIHVTDNAIMNSLLFRATFEKRVKHVIFFSCTVMYQSSETPIKESDFNANDDIHPRYFGVGWTKVYSEKMCEFYAKLGSTKFTILRHSNIYGPYDKFDLEKSHVFGATMTKVLTNTDGKMKVWGTGEEERDLLYVDDLSRFVEKAIEVQQTKCELVNVGLGKAIAVRDLVKKIIQHSGKNINIEYDTTKPTIKTKVCLDITQAKQIFGWQPQITLNEGIQRTMKWCQENIQNTKNEERV